MQAAWPRNLPDHDAWYVPSLILPFHRKGDGHEPEHHYRDQAAFLG
jgi:hypothetical protein